MITLGYIDPAATTLLIQVGAGIAVVVGGAIALYIRRARKMAAKVLKIDENAGKEVEGDIIETTEEKSDENAEIK